MEKRYKIEFTSEQLERVIELVKDGAIDDGDDELVEWLEWKQAHSGVLIAPVQYSTFDLDEIPF
jgi:hypothetical protein